MAATFYHIDQSGVADDPSQPTLIQPSQWNKALKLGAPGVAPSAPNGSFIVVDTSDTTYYSNWSTNLTYVSNVLAIAHASAAIALGTLPAQSGAQRFSNNTYSKWRKADNSADITGLGLDTSNNFYIGQAGVALIPNGNGTQDLGASGNKWGAFYTTTVSATSYITTPQINSPGGGANLVLNTTDASPIDFRYNGTQKLLLDSVFYPASDLGLDLGKSAKRFDGGYFNTLTVTSLVASSFMRTPVFQIGGSTYAATGDFRVQHGFTQKARNNANSADRAMVAFGATTTDTLEIGDAAVNTRFYAAAWGFGTAASNGAGTTTFGGHVYILNGNRVVWPNAAGTGSFGIIGNSSDQIVLGPAGSYPSSVVLQTSSTHLLTYDSAGNLTVADGSVKFPGASATVPAVRLTAGGTTAATASVAIKNEFGSGWVYIFSDYEPFGEYGLLYDNTNDYFRFTSGNNNGLGSFTITNTSGSSRTAYDAFVMELPSGRFRAGGSVAIGGTPASVGLLRLPNGSNLITARNNANTADRGMLEFTSGDVLNLGDTAIQTRFLGTQWGFNAAPDAHYMVLFGGSYAPTGGTQGHAVSIQTALTAQASTRVAGLHVSPSITTAASGTHFLLSAARFEAPIVTSGGSTVTDTATVYISGAMSATVSGRNLALWSASGDNLFTGNILLGTDVRIKGSGANVDFVNFADAAYTNLNVGWIALHATGSAAASSGDLRFPNGGSTQIRNNGNTANLTVFDTSTNTLRFGGGGANVDGFEFNHKGTGGGFAFQTSNHGNRMLIVGGSLVGQVAGVGVYGVYQTTSITGVAGQDIYGQRWAPTFTTAASGTHALLANMFLSNFAVSLSGTATVTDAATLAIADAPSGTVTGNKYALWSQGGINRFDGDIWLGANAKLTTISGGLATIRTTGGGAGALKLESGGYLGVGNTIAGSGSGRFENAATLTWRNVGNTGDCDALGVDANNVAYLGNTNNPTKVRTNFSTPSGVVDGDFWIEASGSSPTRTITLKVRDGGATRTLATLTY